MNDVIYVLCGFFAVSSIGFWFEIKALKRRIDIELERQIYQRLRADKEKSLNSNLRAQISLLEAQNAELKTIAEEK